MAGTKIKGTFLGVPIIRIVVYIGVYIGVPLFWETTRCHRVARPRRRGLLSGASISLRDSALIKLFAPLLACESCRQFVWSAHLWQASVDGSERMGKKRVIILHSAMWRYVGVYSSGDMLNSMWDPSLSVRICDSEAACSSCAVVFSKRPSLRNF